VLTALAWSALAAFGAAYADQPVNGGIDFQPPASATKAEIIEFHNLLLVIITGITLLVLALLLWVMVRYNRRANPTPKRFTHNTLVEVVWTVIPVIILVGIAVQSFPILYREERPPPAELTIKAIGNSWFWQYEYPDQGVSITSNMLDDETATAEGRPRKLAVDEPIYVPINTNVQVLITSNDVIHSWAVPSFGVKDDAIPGRVNEAWFNVDRAGVYYGQCSELCGPRHAFMPIEVRAVTKPEFEAWVAKQGGTIAQAEPPSSESQSPVTIPELSPAPAAQPTR
jgi:cytochrome c oxidase subunit 2